MALAAIGSYSHSFQSYTITFLVVSLIYTAAGLFLNKTNPRDDIVSLVILALPFSLINLINPHWDSFVNVMGMLIGLYLGSNVRLYFFRKKTKALALSVIWGLLIFLTGAYYIPRQAYLDSQGKHLLDSNINFELVGIKKERINSEALRGKVVLMDFWNVRCKWCIVQFDETQQVYENFKNNVNVKIMAVNTGHDKFDKFVEFQEGLEFNFDFVYDTEKRLTNELGFRAFPHNILIDKKGVIRFHIQGYSKDTKSIHTNSLTNLINVLLDE